MGAAKASLALDAFLECQEAVANIFDYFVAGWEFGHSVSWSLVLGEEVDPLLFATAKGNHLGVQEVSLTL
jgi:hypothetical protein